VSQLHEDYREITIMRYFKEKSYTEIAEELGIPIGTVKARLYRSRELLVATFKDYKVKKDRI
jgi:RNA polymerase sigma-70 factor (ECF subfamily)